ncbi:Aste57867_12488 [Aphanomyces stellatus]|uniref:Aste57867_12488 protein n=1 Tax=Aphanomyces stellatus TaxID=120398 RepID=A0A485KVR7_9STRA|nr:hypothetical protein As57867_012442 [Aphanomyces stellatus]VFT89339.1 Aste57867_12488 [Aphanomyces stellatus]
MIGGKNAGAHCRESAKMVDLAVKDEPRWKEWASDDEDEAFLDDPGLVSDDGEDDLKYLDDRGMDKVHMCEDCGAVFSKAAHLTQHKLSHQAKSFMCPVDGCEKMYTRKDHLNRHVKMEHMDAPEFKCSMCGAAFKYKHGLTRHLEEKHIETPDKPYRCGVCQQAFKKKTQLQQHTFVHTGALPFPCDQCDDRFMKKYLLDQHKLRKHVVVASVVTVDFNAERSSDLSLDLRETPVPCAVCGQVLANRRGLAGHMKVHSPKDFACPDCDNVYSTQPNLNRHRRAVHTAATGFPCEQCDRVFAYKHVLAKHVERLHRPDGAPPPVRKRKRIVLDDAEIRRRLVG